VYGYHFAPHALHFNFATLRKCSRTKAPASRLATTARLPNPRASAVANPAEMRMTAKCLKCAEAERCGDKLNLREYEKQLSETCCGWSEGPLLDRIRYLLREELNIPLHSEGNPEVFLDNCARLSVHHMWRIVDAAFSPGRSEYEAKNMEPRYALKRAVKRRSPWSLTGTPNDGCTRT
jgi:hypothetical protein